MTTYADIRSRVLNTLGAEEIGSIYPDALIFDAVCGALDAILPWCAKRFLDELEGDGVAVQFPLPADTYQVDGIMNVDTKNYLPTFLPSPGKQAGDRYKGDPISWNEYPQGSLLFSEPLEAGVTYQVFARAYWGRPADLTETTFVFDFPRYATNGIVLWAASYSCLPSGVSSSQIRQFNLKVDSGVPTDNAIENSARFLYQRFLDEMNKMPKQVSGVA